MENLIVEVFERNRNSTSVLPDKFLADTFIENLFNLLYVNGTAKYNSANDLTDEFSKLEKAFYELLLTGKVKEVEARKTSNDFFKKLPSIYSSILLDAKAILAFDPAAESLDEVLQAYPGFYAIAVHRISHYLYLNQHSLLARLFAEKAHSKTGIDIHPGAQIGEAFAIDHGTGIVIGETTIIGNRVKIYQGVTLGALTVSKENASKKRHPTIEDDVVIYGNATILGGNTIIGRESTIGGNVWLTNSVPAFSVVFHKSDIKIKNNNPFDEPINFTI